MDCADKCQLWAICHEYDLERSYLYLRENSVETNVAMVPMFPLSICVPQWDNTNARRDSAEDFSRLNALLCTAVDRVLISAHCFANS